MTPKKTILETTRLILREMDWDDYDDLCEMLRDPEVMYAYDHAFSEEEAKAWLENQRRRYREDGFGLWAVVDRQTGEMVGQCGLTWQECDGNTLLEVGYLLKKKNWHQGYATEAALACREYAFEKLGSEAVYSLIRDNNFPSQRVALRNGMKPVKTTVKRYYGREMPHIVYEARKKERGTEP